MFKFTLMRPFAFLVLFIACSSAHGVLMDEGKPQQRLGDLSSMVEHKSLRVIVAYDQVGFFINKGKPDGLYVALFRKFKNFLASQYPEAKNLKFYFIPVRQDEVVNYISEGYGDIAVGMQATNHLKRYVDFSIPEKLWVQEIAVVTKNQPQIKELKDFSGRYFMVRKSSGYVDSLKNVNTYLSTVGLPPVKIVYADEYLTDADLVDMVDKGEIKGTVINNSKLVVWRRLFKNVNFATDIPLKVNASLVWAMRHDSPELYKAVNLFLRENRDGTAEGTPIYDRYMRTSPVYESHYAKRRDWLGITPNDLEKFITIFKKYGTMYGLDWKLLMAQAYQESTLNQSVVSRRGAVGIMQVLPSTASEWYINLSSVSDLDNNVHAGTKYMRYMIDNFFSDPEISNSDRLLFALASYNSGPSRITRYRMEAKDAGLKDNVWFNNVEKIAVKHNAIETVNYVKNISQFYISYTKAYELLADKSRKGRRHTVKVAGTDVHEKPENSANTDNTGVPELKTPKPESVSKNGGEKKLKK